MIVSTDATFSANCYMTSTYYYAVPWHSLVEPTTLQNMNKVLSFCSKLERELSLPTEALLKG